MPREEAICADPLIFGGIDTIRKSISDMVAERGSMQCVSQLIDIVVSTLESEMLIARLTGRTHILGGRLSVADAVQRASDLRALVLS